MTLEVTLSDGLEIMMLFTRFSGGFAADPLIVKTPKVRLYIRVRLLDGRSAFLDPALEP